MGCRRGVRGDLGRHGAGSATRLGGTGMMAPVASCPECVGSALRLTQPTPSRHPPCMRLPAQRGSPIPCPRRPPPPRWSACAATRPT
jgi:hypothetical protein